MHYSAKRGIDIACCLSVCLSVCNVGGSRARRSENLATNCTDNQPNIFALRSRKAIHLLQGEHGEILRRPDGELGKVVCWSTKAAISLKRVMIDETLPRRTHRPHQRSFGRYHPRPPTASSFPRLGVCNPNLQSLLSQERVNTDFKFGRNIRRFHRSKAH